MTPSCCNMPNWSKTPQLSTIFPFTIRSTATPVTVDDLPVAGMPASSPLCVPCAVQRREATPAHTAIFSFSDQRQIDALHIAVRHPARADECSILRVNVAIPIGVILQCVAIAINTTTTATTCNRRWSYILISLSLAGTQHV